ncbi:MAG: hypothetical protein IJT94_15280, partial [Oscillibacter sp.]|nr:hypothetical protein [Oscillibacter sp.]
MDYLLFTLTNEMDGVYRYESGTNGSHFYSPCLNSATASPDILNHYIGHPITIDNIRDEMHYLCEQLSPRVTVLLQTVSDIEFPLRGKDENYKNRLALNKLAEALADEFPGRVKLIDIRKYAKYPGDFFEPVANHFNRAIGYSLAMDVLRAMGMENQEKSAKAAKEHIPQNAIANSNQVDGNTVSSRIYLQNGVLHLFVQAENASMRFRATFWRDRMKIAVVSLKNGVESSVNVDKPGTYRATVAVYRGKEKLGSFKTGRLNYTAINCFA